MEADATLKKPFEASALIAAVKPLAEAADGGAAEPGFGGERRSGWPQKPKPAAAAPFVAVVDTEQVRAAVTLALDGVDGGDGRGDHAPRADGAANQAGSGRPDLTAAPKPPGRLRPPPNRAYNGNGPPGEHAARRGRRSILGSGHWPIRPPELQPTSRLCPTTVLT